LKTSTRPQFILYCIAALLINVIPVVSTPFLYLTTIFHELSHGLAALLTGGSVVEFALQLNGAGHLVSRGGNQFIITFSGYFGASVWGALLFHSAQHVRVAKLTLGALLVLFICTLVLWVSSLITGLILALVGLLLLALFKFTSFKGFNHLVRFISVVVIFNAIYSPSFLLYSDRGDSISLAQQTLIPALVWVFVWMAWGLFTLYLLFPKQHKT